jgi:tRNA/rRNA methyltransferase
VPVGAHITDLVSFPLRLVIDIVPEAESTAAAKARAAKIAWLQSRDYAVITLGAAAIVANVDAVLEKLAERINRPSAT